MKFGCCAAIEKYELLNALEYDFIELSGRVISGMDTAQFNRLVRTVKEGRLYCNGFNDYCPPEITIAGPNFNLEQSKAYARRLMERGSQLNIRTIGIGAPASRMLPPGFSVELARSQGLEFLKATAEMAQEYQITILWEACNQKVCNFVNYVAEAVEMVKEVKLDNLMVVADLYHMEIMKEEVESLSAMMPYIRHIHLAGQDSLGGRRFLGAQDEEKTRRALTLLSGWGYNGTVSVEPHWESEGGDAKTTITLLKSIEGALSAED